MAQQLVHQSMNQINAPTQRGFTPAFSMKNVLRIVVVGALHPQQLCASSMGKG